MTKFDILKRVHGGICRLIEAQSPDVQETLRKAQGRLDVFVAAVTKSSRVPDALASELSEVIKSLSALRSSLAVDQALIEKAFQFDDFLALVQAELGKALASTDGVESLDRLQAIKAGLEKAIKAGGWPEGEMAVPVRADASVPAPVEGETAVTKAADSRVEEIAKAVNEGLTPKFRGWSTYVGGRKVRR